MSSRLSDRMKAARRRLFVGRVEEQKLIQRALEGAELPFFVLYIYGPGGIGKSSLLRVLQDVCEEARTESILLDGREIEPSPESFLNALNSTLNLDSVGSPLGFLAGLQDRLVIFLDEYEHIVSLDEWARTEFLPQISEQVLFVLAGRQPPPLAWRADPAWKDIARVVPLRNLSPAEGQTYLDRRQIPPDLHQSALEFTHGHPLALSLVADTFEEGTNGTLSFEPTPDVIQDLVEKFVQGISDHSQRTAVEISALVRVTTEALLARAVGKTDAHELFRWLQTLSFVEASQEGLALHDLARSVLVADLRWRNPERYAELHRTARAYYQEKLASASRLDQQKILWNYIFLHRANPIVQPFFDWQSGGGFRIAGIQPEDVEALRSLVAGHEGEASAELAEHWFRKQPEGVRVLRDEEGALAGFFTRLDLTAVTPEERTKDSAVQAAWEVLEARAPLRANETATLIRHWMAAESYQQVSPVQSVIFVHIVRHYLTQPGLAFSFIPCSDPDFWALGFAYGDLHRMPEADFEIGGRSYGVYGHDWRAVPPLAWLDLMAEREIAAEPDPPSLASRPLLVLSREEFQEAVWDVLRSFHRLDVLGDNPLSRSRLVVEEAGYTSDTAKRAGVLQELILEAIRSLQVTPRGQKFYRALEKTYLEPARTQEEAAEALELPFSTYRRHLKEGIQQVTELLWARELGSSAA